MKLRTTGKIFMLPLMVALMFTTPLFAFASDDPPQEEKKNVFPFEDETLLGFFDANREISTLQKETQERIESSLQQYNLSFERFNQIARAAQIGALDGTNFSSEEIEGFNSAGPVVTGIQREQQGMMQALLAEKGLTMQTYQEIITEFRRNQDLQAYIRELARERALELAREERRRQRETEESGENGQIH